MEIHDLPHVLAALNAMSVVVLLWAYFRIHRGDQDGHRRTMMVAGGIGVVFLAIYFYNHAHAGLAKFGGQGAIRPAYFTLLFIHVLAAFTVAVVVPLAVFNAVKKRFATHRRIVRYAWPLWMFVSVSGLVVYVMAVHLYPTPVAS